MTNETNLTLPEGWRWSSNLIDINRGIAASKIWWVGNQPVFRAKVITDVDRTGQGRLTVKIDAAMWTGWGKRRKEKWEWQNLVDLRDVPQEPVAAAISTEIEFDDIRERIREVARRNGLLDSLAGFNA